ncbi:MAG: hypothetical protein OXF74_03065 [Rhodobacteraceae bacterium]|nr:hypothetical protein [Paracoccaceae bacterium]
MQVFGLPRHVIGNASAASASFAALRCAGQGAAPVSVFTRDSGRKRRDRRPHAVRVERMQVAWRNEFRNVRDTAVNITGINPMTDRCLKTCGSRRPTMRLME